MASELLYISLSVVLKVKNITSLMSKHAGIYYLFIATTYYQISIVGNKTLGYFLSYLLGNRAKL